MNMDTNFNLTEEFLLNIINAILLFTTFWLITKIPCYKNNRGELKLGELPAVKDITITIGNTIYTARGFFKPTGKTLSEKLLRNMEKSLDKENDFCYTIDKSQKGLDCEQERSIS